MPPTDRPFPAETLRAFRTWLGLSQDDVASILGISTRSVQIYEGQGGPEWLRYALMGWATLVHGATPRTAARKLGLPWEHHTLAEGATDQLVAACDETGTEAHDAARSGSMLAEPHDPPPDVGEEVGGDVGEDAAMGDDAPMSERFADLPGRRRGGAS